MNVVPWTAGGGLLPPIRRLRAVRMTSPITLPAGAVTDAIARELRREGVRVRATSATTVDFEGPGFFGLNRIGRKAAVVSHGTVTFDPSVSRNLVWMELQYDPWLTYALPCLAAAVIAAVAMPLVQRCFLIALVGAVARENFTNAADAFERWVRKGVSVAGPYP